MVHCSTSKCRELEWTTNGIGTKPQTVDLETCVFCELIAGKLPISVIDETEDVLALMDIQPVNPGHVLIIPKRRAPSLADLDPTLGGLIFAMGTRCCCPPNLWRSLRGRKLILGRRESGWSGGTPCSPACFPALCRRRLRSDIQSQVFCLTVACRPRWHCQGYPRRNASSTRQQRSCRTGS